MDLRVKVGDICKETALRFKRLKQDQEFREAASSNHALSMVA